MCASTLTGRDSGIIPTMLPPPTINKYALHVYHPCLLGGPKEGGKAMSPLHSWDP